MSEGADDVPAAPATPGPPSVPAATSPNSSNDEGHADMDTAMTGADVADVAATPTPYMDLEGADTNMAVAAAAAAAAAAAVAVANASANASANVHPNVHPNTLPATPATPATPTSGTPQKERHSLTLDQRRALRRWANTQVSRPSHKQCIEWFHRQYQQTISQSTVSHSLSPKYARLDGEPQLSGSRLRFGNWPEVEKLVLLWYKQMTLSGRHPTNEELADKAKSIFIQLPRHRGEEPPEFSPGWIHRFKKRYGLLVRRQRRLSGAAADAADGLMDAMAEGAGSGDLAADVAYLADTVGGFMSITADTDPDLIRETIQRTLGIETTTATCTRVRDEIVLSTGAGAGAGAGAGVGVGVGAVGDPSSTSQQVPPLSATGASDPDTATAVGPPGLSAATTTSDASAATAAAADIAAAAAAAAAASSAGFSGARVVGGQGHDPHAPLVPYTTSPQQHSNGHGIAAAPSTAGVYPNPDDDPEVVLQNALRQLQQQDATEAAEAAAAAETAKLAAAASGRAVDLSGGAATPKGDVSSAYASGSADRPVRCPFCVNQRMLRSIKEAVDHLSTHVHVE